MRVLIGGIVLDTKAASIKDLTEQLQQHYDEWIGPEKIQVSFSLGTTDKELRIRVCRNYGEDYEYSSLFDRHQSILDLDEILMHGDYLSALVPAVGLIPNAWIYDAIEDFYADYRRCSREHGCSRISNLEFNHLSRNEIELYIKCR